MHGPPSVLFPTEPTFKWFWRIWIQVVDMIWTSNQVNGFQTAQVQVEARHEVLGVAIQLLQMVTLMVTLIKFRKSVLLNPVVKVYQS